MAKFPTASIVGVPTRPTTSPTNPSIFSPMPAMALRTSSGKRLYKTSRFLPMVRKSSSKASHIWGSSFTRPTASFTTLAPIKYPASTTSAITEIMTKAVPAFLRTFNLSSKKWTRGLAINAITHPITKGIKNTMTLGSRKTRSNSNITAIPRFSTAFRYVLGNGLIKSLFLLPLNIYPEAHKSPPFLPSS